MNTLRDTDEGRARPSVWPVYVAAGWLLFLGVFLVCEAVLSAIPVVRDAVSRELPIWHVGSMLGWEMFGTTWGFLGLVAARGLFTLRPWGWWCAVMFTAVDCIMTVRGQRDRVVFHGELGVADVIIWVAMDLAKTALLVWPLATRRRLFFPPKQDDEE